MSFTSRVYGMLETELSRRLTFSICPAERSHRDARPPRENSTYRFKVWVRNDADFPLRTIRGTIQPTRATRFQPLRYSVPELRPGQNLEIGTIEALVVGRPQRGSVLDQLASINVSAAADLSTVTFQEWDRPVGFSAPSIRPSGELKPLPLSANPTFVRNGLPSIGLEDSVQEADGLELSELPRPLSTDR